MIDIKLLRDKPEIFYEDLKRRGRDRTLIDEFFSVDNKWKGNVRKENDLRKEKNQLSLEISRLVKEGEDTGSIKKKVTEINEELNKLKEEQDQIDAERLSILNRVPNILHPSVPSGDSDEDNQFIKFVGEARVNSMNRKEFLRATGNKGISVDDPIERKSHVDLIEEMGLVEIPRAGKISGARFYFLKERLFKLEMALVNYAIDFLSERQFTVMEPPPMINGRAISGATDMETFNEAVYKIEGEDLYLISTSEHPLAAMLMDEIIEQNELPVRMAGYSACFRKEAGAHGKDSKGIFRVHNFKKVEQFIFSKEEDSWDFHEELLRNTEDLFQSLKIPYRVINVCTGDIGSLAAKKYDIEGWFPVQGKFRELASISNDTDYQARSLNIRYREKGELKYVHTLNGTAVATTRTLVAIIENFQNGDRIEIPEVLIPYTGFDHIQTDIKEKNPNS
ncbi:MAG: serine--tRNA ligase [Thermoplasmataceae archaeon]